MGEEAGDPELSKYLAGVRWIDTRPREQAYSEKGMFANQNVVAKLRHPSHCSGSLRSSPSTEFRRSA